MRGAMGCMAVCLLSSCQSAPDTKRFSDEGSWTTHRLREEPHRAAVCVARNIDRHKSGFTARIRQGAAPALVEVEVRANEPIALAEFLVSGDGSTARIWTTAKDAYRPDELVAAMIDG